MTARNFVLAVIAILAILFLPLFVLGVLAILMAAFWPRSVVPGLPGVKGRFLLLVIGFIVLLIPFFLVA